MFQSRVLAAVIAFVMPIAMGTAQAHVNVPSLAFFGGFPPTVAKCQRAIAHAADRCVAKSVRARTACLNAQLDGQTCTSDAALDAAQEEARALVAKACSPESTATLQFGGLEDAQQNVSSVCRDAVPALSSLTFGAVLTGANATAVSSATRVCLNATVQHASQLLRFATRARRDAFNRMASRDMTPSRKIELVAHATTRITHAAAVLRRQIEAACPADTFRAMYGRDVDSFLGMIASRSDCFAGGVYVQSQITCPLPVCGNGMQEHGEQCDDGNSTNDDSCRNDCTSTTCETFASTFALLQKAIFEKHQCTDQLCHGSAQQGGLDLRSPESLANLVGHSSQADPNVRRIVPGSESTSMLYLKLAAKTLGEPSPDRLPLSPMPLSAPPLSTDELEAVRLWIHNGASARGVVEGTAALLNACLPAASPPKLPQPPVPASNVGVQLAMPSWVLPAHSEGERCLAAYYDLSAPGAVPADLLVDCPGSFPGTNDHGNNAGKCLPYHSQTVVEDPQGHHLWEMIYAGDADFMAPLWGDWQCAGGANDGASCDPSAAGACGAGLCASRVGPGGASLCGPPHFDLHLLGLGLGPVTSTAFPTGVYATMPLKGIAVWDFHAFNLTSQDTRLEAWANHTLAPDRRSPAQFVFFLDYLFTQDVPPFQTRQYCATYTFDEGSRVFSLRSHTHKRGKRFRVWGPPQTPCGNAGPSPVGAFLSTDPNCLPGEARDLIYENFEPSEPLQYQPQPPRLFSGSDADRTIKFCAVYDNGAINRADVKRASTSPLPFQPDDLGGPCAPSERKCLDGPNIGQPCFGDDAQCPQSVCDACNLRGGVTTDDEMFGIQVYLYHDPVSPTP